MKARIDRLAKAINSGRHKQRAALLGMIAGARQRCGMVESDPLTAAELEKIEGMGLAEMLHFFRTRVAA